ncbi:hypothetical protein K443DRAFT_4293 [Laccaria amethystina LaAM-08-1]|uniref:Anaphase-promoting complex subunit 4 WD40 domain-containing protein n=1 Tax=Laccaria amethystina LaAM-08-1 TaxID=1095629 RepID=A0A0C9XIU0_9AGAR|nr:hypothetical protein K443DRAFT_4293 [Laccaria amethystina LaAM-08-1]
MAHYKHILTIHPEAGKINILSFSPTKRLLASGSSGGLVQIWDLKSRGSTKELQLRSAVLSLAWDASSGRLFIGCKNGTILSLDPSTQRGLSVIRVSDRNVGSGTARTFPVDALAINCAGKVAHTAGRHVLFYHLSSHQFPVSIKALPGPIDLDYGSDFQAWIRAQSLHYIDDNKLAVCYGKLNCIVTWDLTNQQMLWRSTPIFGIFSINKKGDRIVVPDAHSGVHVIPLAENKSSFVLRYYPDPSANGINFGVAFTSNNVLVASGHRGRIVIWSVFNRRITQVLNHPDHWFRAFAAKDDDGISYIAAATGGSSEIMVFAAPYVYRQRKLVPTDENHAKIMVNQIVFL